MGPRGLGESGEPIARMLKLCGHVVFRGGSTTGRARRREGTLREMIEHMRTHRGVIHGLTVDGSKAPRSQEDRRHRHRTRMRTSHHAGAHVVKAFAATPHGHPLPFTIIACPLRGPYFAPESARTQEGLEELHRRLEDDLIDLAAQSDREMGQEIPPNLRRRSEASPTA